MQPTALFFMFHDFECVVRLFSNFRDQNFLDGSGGVFRFMGTKLDAV